VGIQRALGGLLVVSLTACVVGCGGGSGSSSTESAKAATTTLPSPAISAANEPLSSQEARLGSAGYTTEPEEATGTVAAISVERPGVEIDDYADPSRAAAIGRQLKKVFDNHPGRGMLAVHGTRVYWIGEEHRLTAKEKAAFARVVAVAEGSR
jgi:hypothetical protein